MTPWEKEKINQIAKRAAAKIAAVILARADQTGKSIAEVAKEIVGEDNKKLLSPEEKKLDEELMAYIDKIMAEPWVAPEKEEESN